jgi:hypothetical protein
MAILGIARRGVYKTHKGGVSKLPYFDFLPPISRFTLPVTMQELILSIQQTQVLISIFSGFDVMSKSGFFQYIQMACRR